MPLRAVVRADYFLSGMYALQLLGSQRDVVRILNNHDLSETLFDVPSATILFKDMVSSYQAASRSLGIGDFGTQMASLIDIHDYGLMCEYAIQGENLGAALRRLFAMYPIEVQGLKAAISIAGTQALIKQKSDLRLLVGWHHVSNAETCQYMNLIRCYAGSEWTPDLVEVDYPATLRSQEFEAYVSCSVSYDAEAMAIHIPSELLKLRRPSTLDPGKALTFEDVQRLERPKISHTFSYVVESQIHLRLLASKTDRDGLAKKLGCSSRTLQRQLQSDGASYSQILDQVRFERSRGLLRETQLSMAEIADLLNYSHPEHFTRAFKRWSGLSPRQFRQVERYRQVHNYW